eukprot:3737566-Rhodomonas_salina.2
MRLRAFDLNNARQYQVRTPRPQIRRAQCSLRLLHSLASPYFLVFQYSRRSNSVLALVWRYAFHLSTTLVPTS